MKQFVLALALLVAPMSAWALEPSQRAEKFLADVAGADVEKAVDDLFAGSGIEEAKPQEVATLKSQLKMAMGLYGTPLGVEKASEEQITPSVVRVVYLQKFPKYPVAWEFYFYRAKDTWVINSIIFRDQIGTVIGPRTK